jgi:leucyl-tRNA synthetase
MSTHGDTWRWTAETLLQLVAPYAPHIAEELWQSLGHDTSVHINEWPTYDEQYLTSDEMTIVVQVNGKLRGQMQFPSDASKEQILEVVQADAKVATYLEGQAVKKSIYVPGKLVNFVI